MTVRIEIQADSGTEAAAELKRLADGLAIMGLVQQRMLRHPQDANNAAIDAARAAEAKAGEAVAEVVEKTASEAVAEAAKQADTAEHPAAEKADKPKRGRKSKAAKEAEAVAEKSNLDEPAAMSAANAPESKTEDAPAENPNPYRLFDENGAEEELFDTPDAYKTALINMLKDAPDEMTCTSVGKSNEETVKRLQEEGVDFKDIVDAYQGRLAELKVLAKAKAESKVKQDEARAKINAPAPVPQSDGEMITLDAVKAAIVSLSSAKGVPVAIATLKQFGASKAGEVKEGERAAFVKACEEAAAGLGFKKELL